MAVLQFHPEHGVGQGFRHCSGDFYDIFLRHEFGPIL
jgi:hypothetical protein